MTHDHDLGDVVLKAQGISKKLGELLVLRDLDLEIRDIRRPGHVTGQIVGLLGPSGVGKTTLFRILAGLDEPNTGTVTTGPEARPIERGRVGVVAQSYPLLQHRTVLGNLVVAGQQAGLSSDDAERKAKGYLDRFGLEGTGGRYPVQLSGGQKQRVAIAQQFMSSEHLLLMDEPFSGLDPIAIGRVSGLIHEVANLHELNTIIVVTHDIASAIEVCDTLWLMGRDRDEAGRIVPGARIQGSYNLIERGLAWRDGIEATPEFVELLREIKARFPQL